MQAVWLPAFGPPDVLRAGAAPDPVPARGQVVIAVQVANITFIETQMRAGRVPWALSSDALPVVLGNGVGGVVEEASADVPERWIGRRVVAGTGGFGGYAERAATLAGSLVALPDGVAVDAAVAVLADGRTALALRDAARLRPGDRVLVEAAGGGVGTLLVQLAVGAGASVVAAAGAADKREIARQLGAAETVDYRVPGWCDGIEPVDVVFDGIGGAVGAEAFALLAPGGRMFGYGLASGSFATVTDEQAAAHQVTLRRGVPVEPARSVELTRTAVAELAAGRLRPIIGRRDPLADAAAAHAAIEARSVVGKTLLDVR